MGILASFNDDAQWSDGHKLHVVGKLAFSGNYTTGGVVVNFGIAGVRSDTIPLLMQAFNYRGYSFEYVPVTTARDGKLKVYGGASDAAATGTLTSDNTNVANNDTVTIGTQTYTFKTNLTASTTANEVHIGSDADGSLLNLIRAINGSGTPGTDYGSLTPVNASVSAATSVTAHAFLITAKVSGAVGNAIATTETSAHLSFGGATLSGGVDATSTGAELAAGAFPTDLASFTPPFYAIFNQFQ